MSQKFNNLLSITLFQVNFIYTKALFAKAEA